MPKAFDPGIVGPTYQAPMQLQDLENCINWYVEIAEVKGAKMPIALLGCPGLNPLLQLATGSVRGFGVLPGSQSALAVVSNVLYLITVSVPATQTSPPQFSSSIVGTLLTGSGPVSISNNGLVFGGEGGFAVIVDGQYGYYYALPGTPLSVTFTGGVTSGESTISVSSIPNGLVAGAQAFVTDTAGYVPTGTLFTGANFNSVVLNMSQNATTTYSSDTVTITFPQFGQIVDPAFLPASTVDFFEGWLVFSEPDTRTFFTTATTPYTLLFSGLFYALADNGTDNLVALQFNQGVLWTLSEKHGEIWYNAGGTGFGFSRLPGVNLQVGCAATASLTRSGQELVWLAENEQGENFIARQSGYGFERISNHAIDNAIASYPVISDAIGYGYEEAGHFFYMLTFPTADVTWCYDATASAEYGKPCWHQRASMDANGNYHRHRGNCFMNLADVRIVGDYQSGQIHQMSRAYYTDAGNVLRCQRRSPHVWDRGARGRMFYSWLQIEFTPGVGLQVGQGSNPQAMLRWSSDGGFTWSNEMWLPIGVAGATRNRAVGRLLGYAWDRCWEINFSDPVARDVIGATLYAEEEMAA